MTDFWDGSRWQRVYAMSTTQAMIQQVFGGNASLFEAALANGEIICLTPGSLRPEFDLYGLLQHPMQRPIQVIQAGAPGEEGGEEEVPRVADEIVDVPSDTAQVLQDLVPPQVDQVQNTTVDQVLPQVDQVQNITEDQAKNTQVDQVQPQVDQVQNTTEGQVQNTQVDQVQQQVDQVQTQVDQVQPQVDQVQPHVDQVQNTAAP